MTAPPSPWVLAGHGSSLGDPSALVTLVDGQTFCLSSRRGDFDSNPTHGVFFADTRVMSVARLRVDGVSPEPLAVHREGSNRATFVGRHHQQGLGGAHLLVVRRRVIGSVWNEIIEVRNYGAEMVAVTLELEVAADFADVFAVKEGRDTSVGEHSVTVGECELLFRWRHGDMDRRSRLTVDRDDVQTSMSGFRWSPRLEPGETWSTHVDLAVALGDRWIHRRHHHPDMPDADHLNDTWVAAAPRVRSTDNRHVMAYRTSIDDLASLRLHDPLGAGRPVIAAGAPWYMTLFGRDALITAYMTLPVDRELALGVLDALAENQGVEVDADTEEQPGKILHESRHLGIEPVALGLHGRYFGSVDATPLFVVLLGELMRWGISDDDLARLVPHADRALAWVTEFGDRDGDGYVEYLRSSEHGLVNQGWKDSVDGIRYRDGRVAQAPLALCEVQGYVYAAWLARASIADRLGESERAAECRGAALRLRQQFNRDFWIEDLGWLAVALDADKQPVDSLTSNIGHCLWTGIVDDEHAEMIAKQLVSEPMWTGWGIRTLAADEPGFDPMSYHCGTVWPHDGALCVAGLARYGFGDAALTVANGLFDASEAMGGRLPEFFCGFDRADIRTPVPFPTSCSPQAWAAAAPLLLLRSMLGLEPAVDGSLAVDPIPGCFDQMTVSGVHCGDDVFDITVHGDRHTISTRHRPER